MITGSRYRSGSGTCCRRRRGHPPRCHGPSLASCTRAPRQLRAGRKSPHAFLYLVGERVAFRPEVVGLPEVRATVGADTLAAIQVLVRQGHAVLVHDLGVTRRAVRDPERPPVSSSRTSASAANKATVTPQVPMPVQRLIFTMLLRVSRNLSVEGRPSPL